MNVSWKHALTVLSILCLLQGCGGSAPSVGVNNEQETVVDNDNNLPIPDNTNVNDFKILLFGNSHISGQNSLIETLMRHANPNITVLTQSLSGGYLSDHANNAAAIDILEGNNWTHVILQGQKYSQSGTVEYSTSAAETLIAKTKAIGATPILFPEHPQQYNTTEAQRIHDLHLSINEKQRSCIAPVGLVWDYAIAQRPDLSFHSNDGNHANQLGNFLTAMVMYETISGQPAELLSPSANLNIEPLLQQQLGQWVTFVLASHPPCTI